jgi:hypothetical protein
MPIRVLFKGKNLTEDQQAILTAAFERTLHQLNLVDRNDPICEIVARKIMEVGAADGLDPVAISEAALREFMRQGVVDDPTRG